MTARKVRKIDVQTERIMPSGAWLCYCMVDGQLVRRQYMGFTKREAVAMFVQEANGTADSRPMSAR